MKRKALNLDRDKITGQLVSLAFFGYGVLRASGKFMNQPQYRAFTSSAMAGRKLGTMLGRISGVGPVLGIATGCVLGSMVADQLRKADEPKQETLPGMEQKKCRPF